MIQTSVAGEPNSFTSRRHCLQPGPHRRIWVTGQSTTKVIGTAQKVLVEVKERRQLDFTHDTHALARATSRSPSSQPSTHGPRRAKMAPRRARVAPPRLPTREEFLATGLEPVEPDWCSICLMTAPLDEPVVVKCDGRHKFCRECITTWLNGPNKNTCPNCRQVLFEVNDPADPADFDGLIDPSDDSEEEEVDPAVARRLRRSHIGDAFRANGFAEITWNRAYVPPADLYTSFHNDIQWSQVSLRESARAAREWLVNDRGLLEDGGQTITANALGASITVMGNLLMTLNTLERRPWSDADRDTWEEIVVDIWRFMSQYQGTRMFLSSLYLSLMASLLDKHYFGAAHPSAFFREGPLLDDLKVLVNFVVFKSGPFARWTNPPRRPGKRQIKRPRDCPRTASQPAVVQATAWMEEHFE
jgi:hypothetical protein